jgi:hypothetical protein
MGEEKPKSLREPEGMNSLFTGLQSNFDGLFKLVSGRRGAETFAGMDMTKDDQELGVILDGLNAKLEPLRQSNGGEMKIEHVMALIDAIKGLMDFMEKKGAIKPEVALKVRIQYHREIYQFARKNFGPDEKIQMLTMAGAAMELCLGSILNTAIFAVHSRFSQAASREAASIMRQPCLCQYKRNPRFKAAEKELGKNTPQLLAIGNKIRSYILAAGITFMSVSALANVNKHHTIADTITQVTGIQMPESSSRKYVEAVFRITLAAMRMILLYMAFMRIYRSHLTGRKVDFAVFQEQKLKEYAEGAPDQSEMKAYRKLYTQMQLALKRMAKDEKYDPTPLIMKAMEAMQAVSSGETVCIKDFLKPGREATAKDYRRKLEIEKEEKKKLAKVMQGTRKNAFAVSRFELPPIKKKLSRRERLELHANSKKELREEGAPDCHQDVGPLAELEWDPEATPVPDSTPTPDSTPVPDSGPSPVPVEIDGEREKLIKKMSFHRMLDRAQYIKYLKALGFENGNGGKGSHEKYLLKTGGGTIMVVVSLHYQQYNDNILKRYLLRKNPPLNPEWVYWVYCRTFGFTEAVASYKEFFGKEFDPHIEPAISST